MIIRIGGQKVDKYNMYAKMKQLSEEGHSQRKIAETLGISRNTVKKYLEMDAEEMSVWIASTKQRKQKLDEHRALILNWLRESPSLSASQIHDWLEERQIMGIAESTLRKYVADLRTEYQLIRMTKTRMYEAIPDPPMGEQAQLDFGQTWVVDATGKRTKLYVFALVLSHSRYKYMEWWDHPYTATDVVEAHERDFNFFGGQPKTIVYDQDRALFVDENFGDIMFTHVFESYRQVQKFRVHACRGYDPESKGRIENVIGFIKNNFANERLYTNLEQWNQEALAWLARKGNGKQHNTTKLIPAVVFQEEQGHLIPRKERLNVTPSSVDPKQLRSIRKDNTVTYKGNRYSLPLGTYQPDRKVVTKEKPEQHILLIDNETGDILAEHNLWQGKGQLVKDRKHARNREAGIDELATQLIAAFSNHSLAETYLKRQREAYPRYVRDQYSLLQQLVREAPQDVLDKTLMSCLKRELFSATDFKAILATLMAPAKEAPAVKEIRVCLPTREETTKRIQEFETEMRDLSIYTAILGGNECEAIN